MKNTSHKKHFTMTPEFQRIYNDISGRGVNTICIEGKCPNIGECFLDKKVTFLILGDICTRNCAYCSVHYAKKGEELDFAEIENIIAFAKDNLLKHIILTSVARDDLKDGGSGYYARAIKRIKQELPDTVVEALVPDFGYCAHSRGKIIDSPVDIISHNIELAQNVFSKYRSVATYERSLELLQEYAKESRKTIKSGFIIGLGESMDEVYATIEDLYRSGVALLSIGQYLPPNRNSVQPKKYYTAGEFADLKAFVQESYDFQAVSIDIFSRSSYMDV